MSGVSPAWHDDVQIHLTAELQSLRDYLRLCLDAGPTAPPPELPVTVGLPADFVSPLDRLTDLCKLTRFERCVLLLCVGMELDAEFPLLLARAHGDARRNRPTFGLALMLLPHAHWSALCHSRPLRFWRLLRIESGDSPTQSSLSVDERVLHHLVGLDELDGRLEGLFERLDVTGGTVPSQRALVQRLATLWSNQAATARRPPLPLLTGTDPSQRESLAAEAAAQLGMVCYRLRSASLPNPPERTEVVRLWEREALLQNAALLIDWPDGDAPEAQRAITHLLDMLHGPVVMSASGSVTLPGHTTVPLQMEAPLAAEGEVLWRRCLGESSARLAGYIRSLAAEFHLGPAAIEAASADALAGVDSSLPLDKALWTACRRQARPQLGELAQRIESLASWNDLILPPEEHDLLRTIATQVRHRFHVYNHWGFADRTRRGLGISALFAGPTGTGKTLAAEVIASELDIDLYRIDLSQVVSKYIGETEKNLRRIFDAADQGGAILLFDEADALFGKRSEVKDSHDRYANLEVSYLLQRMEAYRGLAILTTNLKGSLDVAFMRRLRFVVQFSFPNAVQRQEIWRRVFPPRTPLDSLDFTRLARVNLAGGNIRNIALNAAFMAAAESGAVGMSHLLRATRMEYAKLDKQLTEAEVAGWL